MTHRFSVWAPRAREVSVDIHGRVERMHLDDGGWHSVEVEDAQPGDDYAFRLDGGEPRPDPRSPMQPHGVHGRSRIVDHASFAWNDSMWRGFPLAQAVIYELHAGTFTRAGTFSAVIEHLDHLQELGVNAIEIMPVAEFAGDRGWGYDGVDLFAPHHAYGGHEGLKQLVDVCHARGMAVVMDVVYNHLGPEGNYLAEYGPYFTDRYATPWGQAVNYDGPDSDEVRRFVLDNAELWLREYHCDGLRLDAVHAIIDTSATHIVEEIVDRVAALSAEVGRALWVIAESDANDPRLVRDRALGGYGVDAQWSDNFHHALHALLTGERSGYYVDFGSADQLCTALRQAFVYTGQYSLFRRRRFGRAVGELPLARFLGYAQNHDQVGNRARGERLCQLVGAGRARIAAALTALSPFVPMLFQGEEWAASTPFQYFTDLGDPALQEAVSSGRRTEFAEFGWLPEDVPDPQAARTFERSRLNWQELTEPEHAGMLRWYRSLLELRRANPELSRAFPAEVRAWHDAERNVLFLRHGGLLVACNLGDAPAQLPEMVDAELLLSSVDESAEPSIGELPPESVAVFRGAVDLGAASAQGSRA